MTTSPPMTLPAPSITGPPRRQVKIAVSGQKGGSGKTTLALGLAAAAARSIRDVVLVDVDPQASSYRTTTRFEEPAAYQVVADTDPAHLDRLDTIKVEGRQPGMVIIDCPGSLDVHAILGPVIKYVDMVVIPYPHDALSLQPTLDTLRYVQAHGGQARVLLNDISPRYPSIETEARALLNTLGVPHFQAAVHHYEAWRHAQRQGVPITEYPGEYASRCREDITAVLSEIQAEHAGLHRMP